MILILPQIYTFYFQLPERGFRATIYKQFKIGGNLNGNFGSFGSSFSWGTPYWYVPQIGG